MAEHTHTFEIITDDLHVQGQLFIGQGEPMIVIRTNSGTKMTVERSAQVHILYEAVQRFATHSESLEKIEIIKI